MPVKGKRIVELTIDSILQRTTDLNIFCHFMPNKNWELNVVTYSPFKIDEKNPSFIIGNKFGNIIYFAFNDPTKKGDCFNFVKQLHGLSNLNETLELIDSSMSLGIRCGEFKERIKVKEDGIEITKRNTLIQVKTKKFDQFELDYWAKYYINSEDLKENNIYAIKEVLLNKNRYHLEQLRFGYLYPGGKWKLYCPECKNKRNKWLSNVSLNISWGLENLNKNNNSVIAKSLKDYIVLRKIYPYVCGVQNESLAAFSEEFVKKLKENSKEIYYFSDADAPGKQASYVITKAFGFKHINPPDRLLPSIKDASDWVRVEGFEIVKQHMINKGIYNN